MQVQLQTTALKKKGIQSLAQRHLRKTDACQQGGLKWGPPVKHWSLYSICDFTEYIGTEVVQSASVFIVTLEVWVVPEENLIYQMPPVNVEMFFYYYS